MLPAPIPDDDAARVAAVRRLALLGAAPEARFERMTRFAADLFGVPFSMVTLIDSDREFHVACHGLDPHGGDRAISFCGHAVFAAEALVVPDTRLDPRFVDNPMVTGAPGIRFYAGVPLRGPGGDRVGVFCIKDTEPREFDGVELERLRSLAAWAEREVNVDLLQRTYDTRGEMEALYSNLLERSSSLLCIANTNGYFERVSPEFTAVLGYPEKEILGRPFVEMVHPDDRQSTLDAVRGLSNGEAFVGFENRYICADGTVRVLLWNATPFGDKIYATASDVTEARAKAAELRDHHELLQRVLDNIPIFVVLTGIDGRVSFVNREFERELGWSAAELQHANLLAECYPDPEEQARALRAIIDAAPTWSDFETRTRDGRVLSTSWRNVRLEMGQTLGLGQDVSARRQHERELCDAARAAEAATRAKSEFLAAMSHEIRTPMNGILGMAELLLGMGLTPEQSEFVETLRGSGESLLRIINDILDFSKIEAGKLDIEAVPFDLDRTVGDVVGLLRAKAAEKGLTLSWIGQDAGAPQYVGDPSRVRQIVFNLVGNAIKFTAHGGVTIRATSTPQADGRVRVRLEVTDTGIGIPESVQQQLFQKFTQADSSTTRRFGGTGLGLAISRQLVELMGGIVELHSVEGEGSTFAFELPLEIATPGALVDAPSVEAAAAHMPHYNASVSVLLVDDNVVNQKVAVRMLERFGCYVTAAANGVEAVELASLLAFDLIFMDCQMPEMDGFEAATHLRAAGCTTPIVALTANALVGDRNRCIEAGMNDYLAKPVRAEALGTMLQRYVGSGEQDTAAA